MNSSEPDKLHDAYRTFGSYRSLSDPDVELRDYWRSKTPHERWEALEELRIRIYGEAAVNARVQRVFGGTPKRALA